MKESRSPVSSFLAVTDDERIVVQTVRTERDKPDHAKKVRIVEGASQNETAPLAKTEEEDEDGIAVLPVAGLFLLALEKLNNFPL